MGKEENEAREKARRDKNVKKWKQNTDRWAKWKNEQKEKKTVKEENEDLNELSSSFDGTLSRYLRKARRSVNYDEKQRRPKLISKLKQGSVPSVPRPGTNPDVDKLDRKIARRKWGIKKASAQAHREGARREAESTYERMKGAKTFKFKKRNMKEENEEPQKFDLPMSYGGEYSVRNIYNEGAKSFADAGQFGGRGAAGLGRSAGPAAPKRPAPQAPRQAPTAPAPATPQAPAAPAPTAPTPTAPAPTLAPKPDYTYKTEPIPSHPGFNREAGTGYSAPPGREGRFDDKPETTGMSISRTFGFQSHLQKKPVQ